MRVIHAVALSDLTKVELARDNVLPDNVLIASVVSDGGSNYRNAAVDIAGGGEHAVVI